MEPDDSLPEVKLDEKVDEGDGRMMKVLMRNRVYWKVQLRTICSKKINCCSWYSSSLSSVLLLFLRMLEVLWFFELDVMTIFLFWFATCRMFVSSSRGSKK